MGRRLARFLLRLATTMSLALLFATIVLWARSYWTADYGRYSTADRSPRYAIWCIASRRGRLSFFSVRTTLGRPDPGLSVYTVPRDKEFVHGDLPMWSHRRATLGKTMDQTEWRAPHWAVAALLAVAPAIRGATRRRPPRNGLCPACGYDLRATRDRCPECGAVPSHPAPPFV